MRIFMMILLLLTVPAFAQTSATEGKEGELLPQPLCTYLINRSDQTIIGTISTASQTLPSGDSVKHRSNFKLAAGAREQICAAGPFYEGRRLELVIRTLIPLFSCKTKLDQEIFLDSLPQPGGFRKLSATCS